MKKMLFFAGIAVVLVALTMLGTSCQKEVNRPDMPEIIMSYERTVDGEVITERQAVANGQVVFLPDSTLNAAFWTNPLTSVTWTLSGPQTGEWVSDQLTIQFMYTGTYTLAISSFGVDWSITIIVGGDPTASQVGTRFVGSTFDGTMFHYTFRINRPIYVLDTDVLFRITELGDDVNAEYLPYLDGVSFVGTDSIDITFAYPPSGNESLNVKFIAGRMEGTDPVWFNADPDDPYKCQDAPPALDDILQANLKNGLALPPGQTFTVPAGASTSSADYGEDLPVVLMSVNPGTGLLHLWFFTLSENPVFRYKTDDDELDFTEMTPTSAGSGYWHVALPLAPANGYYTFDFGTGTGLGFIQDQFVPTSTLYYIPTSTLKLYL